MSEASRAFKRKEIFGSMAQLEHEFKQQSKARQAELANRPGYKAMLADPEYRRLASEHDKVVAKYRSKRAKWRGKLHEELTPAEKAEDHDLTLAQENELQPLRRAIDELQRDYGLADLVDNRLPLQRLLDKCLSPRHALDEMDLPRLSVEEQARLAAHLKAPVRLSELQRDPQQRNDRRRLKEVLIFNRELNTTKAAAPTSTKSPAPDAKPDTDEAPDAGGPEQDPHDTRKAVWAGKRVYLGNDTQVSRLFWLLAKPVGRAASLAEVQRAIDGMETMRDMRPDDVRKADQRVWKVISKLRAALMEAGLDDHVLIARGGAQAEPEYSMVWRFRK